MRCSTTLRTSRRGRLLIDVGKAVPGLLLGLAQCVLITLIVTQVFGIAPSGSPIVLFVGLAVFLIAIIGLRFDSSPH